MVDPSTVKENIAANVWWIPIVDDVINPLIVSKRLGNVAKSRIALVAARGIEQMFFKE